MPKHNIQFLDDALEDGDATVAPIDGSDEDDFVVPPSKRLAPLTITLMAGVLVGVAFIGGVFAQKHLGSSNSAGGGTNFAALRNRTGTGGAGGTGAAGAGGEGFPAFGNFGGGTGGTGAAGAAGGTTAGGSTGGSASSTAVIGQVVSVNGSTMTVKNLGGKTVTVKLGSDTTITKSTTLDASALTAGTTITVDGTTAADGTVTASAVTTRDGN